MSQTDKIKDVLPFVMILDVESTPVAASLKLLSSKHGATKALELDSNLDFNAKHWMIDVEHSNFEAYGLLQPNPSWGGWPHSSTAPRPSIQYQNCSALASFEMINSLTEQEISEFIREGLVGTFRKGEMSSQQPVMAFTQLSKFERLLDGKTILVAYDDAFYSLVKPIPSTFTKRDDGQWRIQIENIPRTTWFFSAPAEMSKSDLKSEIEQGKILFDQKGAIKYVIQRADSPIGHSWRLHSFLSPLQGPFRVLDTKLPSVAFGSNISTKHLPRTLGEHPKSGMTISCHMSMVGPLIEMSGQVPESIPVYFRRWHQSSTWIPLSSEQSLHQITLEDALESLSDFEHKKQEEKLRKEIRVLGNHNGQEISVQIEELPDWRLNTRVNSDSLFLTEYTVSFDGSVIPAIEFLTIKREDVVLVKLKGNVGAWDARKVTLSQALRFIENENTGELKGIK